MSTYFILANHTQQAIGTIKESPGRVRAARDLAKACGAEKRQVYLTMGGYDIIKIIDAPSDDALARFVLALSSKGNLKTTTLRAFEEAEFSDIVGSLPTDWIRGRRSV